MKNYRDLYKLTKTTNIFKLFYFTNILYIKIYYMKIIN